MDIEQRISNPMPYVMYIVTPRLVIGGGFEIGLTSGGPHRHAFFGATYSIANLYRADPRS